jgi:DNA processing protein
VALRHCLQLALTTGIGPVLTRRLIAAAGSAQAACEASVSVLQTIDGIGRAKASVVFDALRIAAREVDEEIAKAQAAKARILSIEEDEFPPLLKEIPDPPVVLYVKGGLEDRDLHAVAIVGSRKCSMYGREQAERFAALLAGAGVTVVSGGARGVDSAAHRGAMSPLNGRTIAVLGCGVDVVYPPENAGLFQQIAGGRGAVVSEYPMGTPPVAENFPRRNRIISGLSRGVLVVEADERSGALITARQAIDDQGRTVFALPGRIDNPTSAGPHKLIRDGATLVTGLEDILSELGPLPDSVVREPPSPINGRTAVGAPDLSAIQSTIVGALRGDALDVDAIVERTDLDASVVLRELTMLSLRAVVRREGNVFSLVKGKF